MEIETKIRKVGHSIGIVTAIPKELVEKNRLKIGNLIKINIVTTPQVKLWGLLKGKKELSNKTSEQLWEEIDEGWEN